MKEVPTFADMVLRESFRSKNKYVPTSIGQPLAEARRFVLDDTASEFLSDLAHANFARGMKDPKHGARVMEASRILARLPHAITWIEYNPRAERKRTLEAYPWAQSVEKIGILNRPEKVCANTGWLMFQEAETAFRAKIFNNIGYASMTPFDFVWTTDDQRISVPTLIGPDDTEGIPNGGNVAGNRHPWLCQSLHWLWLQWSRQVFFT
jgi:hypothetical protein